MSNYTYSSQSQYPKRAIKRMIGFQIFCYRHKYHIKAENFCKRADISLSELEKLELGHSSGSGPKWSLIYKVLKANNLRIDLSLSRKE